MYISGGALHVHLRWCPTCTYGAQHGVPSMCIWCTHLVHNMGCPPCTYGAPHGQTPKTYAPSVPDSVVSVLTSILYAPLPFTWGPCSEKVWGSCGQEVAAALIRLAAAHCGLAVGDRILTPALTPALSLALTRTILDLPQHPLRRGVLICRVTSALSNPHQRPVYILVLLTSGED